MHVYRREGPRVEVEALCWELADGDETSAMAIDLSATGLRIERPYLGGPSRRRVPLQIELPGVDEVMWARADACFDILVPTDRANDPRGGPLGLIRRTGYRIVAAASRDLRMLKDFVVESHRARLKAAIDDALKSCSAARLGA